MTKQKKQLAAALASFDSRPTAATPTAVPAAQESSAASPSAPKESAPTATRQRRQAKPKAPTQAATARPPARVGKKMIAGHFPPEVSQQLRVLAAQEDTSTQALLAEALNLLFAKYGRSQIA